MAAMADTLPQHEGPQPHVGAAADLRAGPAAVLLVDDQQQKLDQGWITPRLQAGAASTGWSRRTQHLIQDDINNPAVTEHVMKDAQQILERTREVHSDNPRTYTFASVAVDGKVQFGKTTSMVALTSLALDCRFKLVLVLAGLQINLRNQTQQRFERYFPAPFAAALDTAELRESPLLWLTSQLTTGSAERNDKGDIFNIVKGLFGSNGAPVLPSPQLTASCRGLHDLLLEWRSLQEQRQRSRPAFIGVIKKVTRSLQAVERLLLAVPWLARERVLIIDDEYDAATFKDPDQILKSVAPTAWAALKGQAARDPGDCVPAAISRIRKLCSSASGRCRAAYVGYTATSYAPLLANRVKLQQLGMRVMPDQIWLLEQHPDTASYVGLDEMFGPDGDLHGSVKIIPENDITGFTNFKPGAETINKAKGQLPKAARAYSEGGRSKDRQLAAQTQSSQDREPVGQYDGRLSRVYFRVLADYLFTGAIRHYRRVNSTPVQLSKEQQRSITEALISKIPRQSPVGLVADADALARGDHNLERRGVVQTILRMCSWLLHERRQVATAPAGYDLITAVAEAAQTESAHARATLAPHTTDCQDVLQLLTGLQTIIRIQVNKTVPGPGSTWQIQWPEDTNKDGLFDRMQLLDDPHNVRSYFLWRALDGICTRLQCNIEIRFMTWSTAPGSGQQEPRLTLAAVKHLGASNTATAVEQLVVLADPVDNTASLGPTIIRPRGATQDRQFRQSFAQACSNLNPLTGAVAHGNDPVLPSLKHTALVNPAVSVNIQFLVAAVLKQAWVILSMAVKLWLEGVQHDQLPATGDLEEQMKAWWDGDDNNELAPGWSRDDVLRIQQRDFCKALDRSNTYMQEWLLGPDGILQEHWRMLCPPGSDPARYPPNPAAVAGYLRYLARNTKFSVINDRSRDLINNGHPHNIFVGGNVFSRGITLEGLTVTLYANTCKTEVAEVKLQAARWFGHRDDYRDLLRVYMLERSRHMYECFTAAAAELRRYIRESIIRNPRIDGSLARLFSLQQQNSTKGLTAAIQQYLALASPSRMRDAQQSDSTHFLSPAFDEVNAGRNYTALLQLLQQLRMHREKSGSLGTGQCTLGELDQVAQIYHKVPLSVVMDFLSRLFDFSGSQQEGQQLARVLQHSGSRHPQQVNVVIRGYHPAQRKHGGIRCSSELAVQRHAKQNGSAAGVRAPTGSRYAIDDPPAVTQVNLEQLGELYASHMSRWNAAAAAVPEVGADRVAAAIHAAETGPTAVFGQQPLLPVHAQLLRRNRDPQACPPWSAFLRPHSSRSREDGLTDMALDAIVIERADGKRQLADECKQWYNMLPADEPAVDEQPGSSSDTNQQHERGDSGVAEGAQIASDGKYLFHSRTCYAPPVAVIYFVDPHYAGMYKPSKDGTPERLWFDTVYCSTSAPRARAAAYPVPLVVLKLSKFGGMHQFQPGTSGYPQEIVQLVQDAQEAQLGNHLGRKQRNGAGGGGGGGGEEAQLQADQDSDSDGTVGSLWSEQPALRTDTSSEQPPIEGPMFLCRLPNVNSDEGEESDARGGVGMMSDDSNDATSGAVADSGADSDDATSNAQGPSAQKRRRVVRWVTTSDDDL